MDKHRRLWLKAVSSVGAVAAGFLKPVAVLAAAWNNDAFRAKTAAEALTGIGAANAVASKAIAIEMPDVAEHGAVVPVEVMSNIAGTTSISVLVEKNPFPLVGKFDFMGGALPFVKLNVKVNESSNVRVVAEAGGKHYFATKETKVTIAACDG